MNKQSAFSVAAIGANSAGLSSYTSSATSTFTSQVAAGQSAANLAQQVIIFGKVWLLAIHQA